MAVENKIRCRPIGTEDLAGVAELLARGFPTRSYRYWARGLARLAGRAVPEGLPRFGFLLESAGKPVGVILLIAQTITHEGPPYVRCNLASWYVEPAFRSHATLLSMVPFRYKAATLLNISAAPNTWPTIEAQGFTRYSVGQRIALPALSGRARGLRITPFDPAQAADLPEAGLLADHAAAGCLSLVGQGPEGPSPFVFLPLRMKEGRFWFPGVQLIFCRSMEDLVRFAAPLGRHLLRRGRPLLVFDAPAEMGGLPGLTLRARGRRYVRGARQPRLGDLAYTEFTIFGA